MKRAALYCRVSSLKQVREGDSLDAQISALRKYVAEHNAMRRRMIATDGKIDAGIEILALLGYSITWVEGKARIMEGK